MQLTGPNCNSLRKTGVCPKFLGYQDVIPILMDFVKGHFGTSKAWTVAPGRPSCWLGSSQLVVKWGYIVMRQPWGLSFTVTNQLHPVTTCWCVLRREWMGCWGLLGLLIVSSCGSFPTIPYVKRTSKTLVLHSSSIQWER